MMDEALDGRGRRLTAYTANIFDIDYTTINAVKSVIAEEVGCKQGVVLDYSCGESPLRDLFDCDTWIRADIEENPAGKDLVIDPDSGKTGLEAESIDLVICTYGLEHIPEPQKAIFEFLRVLKKRGLLFISVPFINRLHEDPIDYHRFTTYYWDKFLCDNFEIKKIKVGNRWFVLFSLWYESIIDENSGSKPGLFNNIIRRIYRVTLLPIFNLTIFKVNVNKNPSVYYHEIIVAVKK